MSSNDNKVIDQAVVPLPRTDLDVMSEIANGFLQVAVEKSKLEAEKSANAKAIREKELIFDKSIFKYKFWLMAAGLLFIVLVSAGLIFHSEEIDKGIAILSHTAALIGGVVAGVGYEHGKRKK
jgi:capsular polysaccharide biosynthesis protein